MRPVPSFVIGGEIIRFPRRTWLTFDRCAGEDTFMEPSETRYAKSGDLDIAYQVSGTGPIDLVWVNGYVNNIELQWEHPGFQEFNSGLTSFCRLIRFDRRGTGSSDRTVSPGTTLEQRMDDVRAVMDAVGSRRAALFGMSEGGPMSVMFSATYPERTLALVLYGAFARHPSRSSGASQDEIEARFNFMRQNWGTGVVSTARIAPSHASDEAYQRYWARFERLSCSPSAMVALARASLDFDVRDLLPAIRVPTLVLHRSGDMAVPVEHGRYLAEHIPGAKYVEMPGIDHAPTIGDSERIIGEIEEFLTGSRSEVEIDRVLATVLFTDVVDSTKRAAALGDRPWRALIDRHDQIVRQQLARFRGREVKNLGDGFLATFDGPARAVRCAAAIADTIKPLGIAVRGGLHTGEIELKGDDIGGIAVNIAARVAATAGPNETLVSSTVRDLVAGSGLQFQDRGLHHLKGLPDHLRLYSAASGF
jgi:pimeloyl-ACP methyl ester carboxylesterase/class 3 adenylate cyclase